MRNAQTEKVVPLNRLTVVEASRQMRNAQVSARQLTQACLDQIDSREHEIRAWVHIDREGALAAADRCDAMASAGQWLGPLHGIAVGIKDIFDVAGMPTAFGSNAWPVSHPTDDSAAVSRLRRAGAVILGKTVTTAFAMGDAGPTRNPWNTDHTPGGSSSGSAAAVADAMCFAAVGTQTVGSVIRPCSFNGLAGFKPSHGAIDIAGVQPLSWRLDHVGGLTRTVSDARLIWQVLRRKSRTGERTDDWLSTDADDVSGTGKTGRRPTRVWRCRQMFESLASDEMRLTLEQHCRALADAGVEIVDRPLPEDGEHILAMHQVILAAEAAAVHADAFQRYGKDYPPNISALIVAGQSISATDYLVARQFRRQAIASFTRSLRDVDAAIMPAATGAAPAGLSFTGDRQMSAPTSFLGLPVVCFPAAIGAGGLPLGLQLMGPAGSEDQLLDFGQFCESVVGFTGTTDSAGQCGG